MHQLVVAVDLAQAEPAVTDWRDRPDADDAATSTWASIGTCQDRARKRREWSASQASATGGVGAVAARYDRTCGRRAIAGTRFSCPRQAEPQSLHTFAAAIVSLAAGTIALGVDAATLGFTPDSSRSASLTGSIALGY